MTSVISWKDIKSEMALIVFSPKSGETNLSKSEWGEVEEAVNKEFLMPLFRVFPVVTTGSKQDEELGRAIHAAYSKVWEWLRETTALGEYEDGTCPVCGLESGQHSNGCFIPEMLAAKHAGERGEE